ncbi:hypothetical protein BaRGS_00040197 [Batillaria attramentaria]|uniref:Uncharacterized protein n=1 Tax=Batillaria attramentaria TaxID=370345 RepID=A0ABD0J174_9CAEN
MSLFRCAGDIIFDNVEPLPGQICNVRLKQFSETCNFLQHLSPLTPEHPYFFAQIRALAPFSKITLGIAGPDIAEDAHPGNWISSVGYQSDNGTCCSSHRRLANTEGEKFGIGDVFDILHCHLPKKWIPSGYKYSEKNMLHWIRPPYVIYDMENNQFVYDAKEPEAIIQSPLPLSTEIQHFEVIIKEVSNAGGGPAIALATCSPLIPSPSCSLSKDYLRFLPEGNNVKVKVGQRLGWGVHYSKAARSQPNFDPRAEQLILCFVTLDTNIVHMQMIVQPPGGFFPLVVLKQWASRVSIDMETNPRPVGLISALDEQFAKVQKGAEKIIAEDRLARAVQQKMFRCSSDVEVSVAGPYCRVRLPATAKGIHLLQFLSPLTPTNSYFFCQIRQLNEDSAVSVGVAPKDIPLNRHPGKFRPSVGWHSRLGKLFRNDRSDGNLAGHRYMRGDCIGVEMEAFATEMSVALFSRNFRPVGTCYYTQKDRSQFLPTIGLCGNGYEIQVDVCWQNMNGGPPIFSVVNLEDWCLPPGAVVDSANNTVTVKEHTSPAAIQAPYSLNKGYNHFEICLVDDFGPEQPPPAIVLSTATPLDPPPLSHFKLDFLRFWAVNEASCAVRRGDLVGWGVLYLDDSLHHDEEQLVVCYLTVNRKVLLVRVMFQPPGGFYPLVILPQGVNRVQMEFGATVIKEHPITEDDVKILLHDTQKMIAEENEAIAQGRDPHELHFEESLLFRPLPSANRADEQNSGSMAKVKDTRVDHTGKTNKMATVVTELMLAKSRSKASLVKSQSTVSSQSDQSQSRSCVIL